MKKISANGLTFMIDSGGQGEPLLFLQGTASDLRRQPGILDSLLTESFDVLVYDQRGSGQTDKPKQVYTMADYAEDAAAILEVVGWSSAHIVGYSFGGMVAQELAIRYPERIKSLSLVACTAGGKGGSSYPIEKFMLKPSLESSRRHIEVADTTFTAQWQQENKPSAGQRIAKHYQYTTEFIDEAQAMEGLTRQLEARAKHNTYDRLHLISARTLVLAGANDGQAPMEFQRNMAEKMPNAVFKTMVGSHFMLNESDQVYKFIKQHVQGLL